jgi:hypothetical protein
MILLMNLLGPLFVVAMILLAMRLKKVYPLYIAVFFVIIYSFLQPSYMPKGTVMPAVPNAPFEVSDKPIKDRILKPISSEVRDARMAEVVDLATKRREELIQQIKSEKGITQ